MSGENYKLQLKYEDFLHQIDSVTSKLMTLDKDKAKELAASVARTGDANDQLKFYTTLAMQVETIKELRKGTTHNVSNIVSNYSRGDKVYELVGAVQALAKTMESLKPGDYDIIEYKKYLWTSVKNLGKFANSIDGTFNTSHTIYESMDDARKANTIRIAGSDKRGQGSNFSNNDEKVAWMIAEEAKRELKGLKSIDNFSASVPSNSHLKGIDTRSINKITQYSKNNGINNIFFDTETFFDRSSNAFGLSEIGFGYTDKSGKNKESAILVRMDAKTRDYAESLINSLLQATSDEERRMRWSHLSEVDRLALLRLTEDYNISNFHQVMVNGKSVLIDMYGTNIKGRQHLPSDKISVNLLNKMNKTLKVLSDDRLPTATQAVEYFKDIAEGKSELCNGLGNAGNLISYNGNNFDVGVLSDFFGNHSGYKPEDWEKLIDKHHIDAFTIVKLVFDKFSDNKIKAIFKNQSAVAEYLTKKDLQDILGEAGVAHTASYDVKMLRTIFSSLLDNKEFLTTLSDYQKTSDTIKKGQTFIAKSGYRRKSKGDYFVRKDGSMSNNMMPGSAKILGDEYLLHADGVYTIEDVLTNGKGVKVKVHDESNGTNYYLQYDSLQAAETAISGVAGKILSRQGTDKAKIEYQTKEAIAKLDYLSKYINSDGFGYYQAQKIFGGLNNPTERDRGFGQIFLDYIEGFAKLPASVKADPRIKKQYSVISKVYSLYTASSQMIDVEDSTQFNSIFNYGINQIKHTNMSAESIVRNAIINRDAPDGAASGKQYASDMIIWIKDNPNLFMPGVAQKLINSIRSAYSNSNITSDPRYGIQNLVIDAVRDKITHSDINLEDRMDENFVHQLEKKKFWNAKDGWDIKKLAEHAPKMVGADGEWDTIEKFLESIDFASHETGTTSTAKMLQAAGVKRDLIPGLIDVNKSASNALQKIVKSIAGTAVNFNIQYHKSSGELELFFYNAADENYQHKASFVIPLYDGSGSGRYHRQSISNSLVAYQDKKGNVRFIDSFGKAINDLADYLVGNDGKFKFANALVRGSGANSRFLKGGKDILDEDLKYSSSASTVGISNDISNSLRAGLTPEDMVMKSTQLSLITLNEQLAKRVMGEQFKGRSRDIKSVSQIITTYAVLRNKSPKLANTFLQNSDLNKYVPETDIDFAIQQIESAYSTVLKTIPINVSSSVEDAVIEGLVRTSGGHSMVSFGSTIIGSGRGTTQRLTNYLRKNVKNVKDYEEQYKNLVHRSKLYTNESLENGMYNLNDIRAENLKYNALTATQQELYAAWMGLARGLSKNQKLTPGRLGLDSLKTLFGENYNPIIPTSRQIIKTPFSIEGSAEMGLVTRDTVESLASIQEIVKSANVNELLGIGNLPRTIRNMLNALNDGESAKLSDADITQFNSELKALEDSNPALAQSLKFKLFGNESNATLIDIDRIGDGLVKFVSQAKTKTLGGRKFVGEFIKGNINDIGLNSNDPVFRLLVASVIQAKKSTGTDAQAASKDIAQWISELDDAQFEAMMKDMPIISTIVGASKAKDMRYAAISAHSNLGFMINEALSRGADGEEIANKLNKFLNTKAFIYEQDVIKALGTEGKALEAISKKKGVSFIDSYQALVKDVFGGIFTDKQLDYMQYMQSGQLNQAREYGYMEESTPERSRFKIGPKDREMLRKSLVLSGSTPEQANLVLNTLVKESRTKKFGETLWSAVNKVYESLGTSGTKFNPNDEGATFVLRSTYEDVQSKSVINITDLGDLITWKSKPSPSDLAQFMGKLYNLPGVKNSMVDGYGIIHLDVSEGIGVDNGLHVGNAVKYSLALPVIDPSLIKGQYDERAFQLFSAVSGLISAFSADAGPEALKSAAERYYINMAQLSERNSSIARMAFEDEQEHGTFKKANKLLSDLVLGGENDGQHKIHSFFDNAAFLSPESVENLLKHDLTHSKADADDKKAFINNYERICNIIKDFHDTTFTPHNLLDPSIANLKGDEWKKKVIQLEAEAINHIMEKVTIQEIGHTANGNVRVRVGDTWYSEDQMWDNPYLDFIARRYPTVAQMALQKVRLYAYAQIQDKDQAFIGNGAYLLMNGDYDGDAFQLWNISGLSANAKDMDPATAKQIIDRMQQYQDYRATLRNTLEWFSKKSSGSNGSITLSDDSEAMLQAVIDATSKFNKSPLGGLSLKGTAVRNLLDDLYITNTDISDEQVRENFTATTFTVGLMHFLEQESISAKKIDDIVKGLATSDFGEEDALKFIFGVNNIGTLLDKMARNETNNPLSDDLDTLAGYLKDLGYLKGTGDNLALSGKVANEMLSTIGADLAKYLIDSKAIDFNKDSAKLMANMRTFFNRPDALDTFKAVLFDSMGGDKLFAGMSDQAIDDEIQNLYTLLIVQDRYDANNPTVSWNFIKNAVLKTSADAAKHDKRFRNIFQAVYNDKYKHEGAHGHYTEDELIEKFAKARQGGVITVESAENFLSDILDPYKKAAQALGFQIIENLMFNPDDHSYSGAGGILSNLKTNTRVVGDLTSSGPQVENPVVDYLRAQISANNNYDYRSDVNNIYSQKALASGFSQLYSIEWGNMVHELIDSLAHGNADARGGKFDTFASTFMKGQSDDSKQFVKSKLLQQTDNAYQGLTGRYGDAIASELSMAVQSTVGHLAGTLDQLFWDKNTHRLTITDTKNLKGGLSGNVLLQTALERMELGTYLDRIAEATDNHTTNDDTFKDLVNTAFSLKNGSNGNKITGNKFYDAIFDTIQEMRSKNLKGSDMIHSAAIGFDPKTLSWDIAELPNFGSANIIKEYYLKALGGGKIDFNELRYLKAIANKATSEIHGIEGMVDDDWSNMTESFLTGKEFKSASSDAETKKYMEDQYKNLFTDDERMKSLKSAYDILDENTSSMATHLRDLIWQRAEGQASSINANEASDELSNALKDANLQEDAFKSLERIYNKLSAAEAKYTEAVESGSTARADKIKTEIDEYEELLKASNELIGDGDKLSKEQRTTLNSKRSQLPLDKIDRAKDFAKHIGLKQQELSTLREQMNADELTAKYSDDAAARYAAKQKVEAATAQIDKIEKWLEYNGVSGDSDGKATISAQEYSRRISMYRDALKSRARYQSILDTARLTPEESDLVQDKINKANSILNGAALDDETKSSLRADFDLERSLAGQKNKGVASKIGQLVKGGFNQFLQYTVVLGGIKKIATSLTQVVALTQQLDAVMTNLRIVTGGTQESTRSLMKTYSDMAKELGTTTSAIAASGNEWLRQGFSIAETNQLIEQSVKLSRLGMIDGGKATQYLTSTLKGFRMEAFEASNIVDKLTTLDLNYATSAGAIAEAMSRTAAVAKAAGMDLDSTAAALTTIMDITQQDPGSTGTALRSILSRYGSINVSSYKASLTGEDTEGINNIEKVLKTIGITIRQSGGEMKDFNDVLDELASKWDNLNDVEQNAISTAMAGTRQRNAFVTLLENYDQYQKAIEISQNSEGQAALKYQAYMDSIEYSLQRLKASWEELTMKLDLKDTMKSIIDTSSWLVEHLPAVLDKIIQVLTMYRVTKAAGKGDLTGPDSLIGGLSKTGKLIFGEDEEGRTGLNKIFHFRENSVRRGTRKGIEDAQGKKDTADAVAKGVEKAVKSEQSGNRESGIRWTVLGSYRKAEKSVLSEYDDVMKKAEEDYNKAEATYDYFNTKKNWDKLLAADEARQKVEKERDEALADIKFQRNEHLSQSLSTGIIAGATAAVSAAMAGNNSEMGNVFAAKDRKRDNNYGSAKGGAALQDLETTAGDRALSAGVQGVGMGAAAAAGSLVGGPLGMAITALGSLASSFGGDALATWLKELIHGDELNRKERVMAANEIIKTINSTKDTLNDSIKLAATEIGHYTIEDENKAAEIASTYKQQLSSELWFEDASGQRHELYEMFLQNLTSQGLDYGTDVNGALRALDDVADLNQNSDKIIQAFAAATTALETAANYTAHEEDIWDLRQKLNSDESVLIAKYNTLLSNGDSIGAAEIAEEYQTTYDQDIKSGVAKRRAQQAQLASYEEANLQGDMEAAFHLSGVSAMSTMDIATADRNRVIYEVARQWQESNKSDNVFDSAGNLTDSAYKRINSFIRALDNFKPLYGSDQKFLGEITSANATERRNQILSQARSHGFTGDFADIVANYTQKDWVSRQFGITDSAEIRSLMDAIGSLDPSRLQNFAHALGMTTEQLSQAGNKFDWLSDGDLTESADGLAEKFKTLSQVVSELVSNNGILSQATINNLVSTSPYLLYDSAVGTGTSTSSGLSTDNVLRNYFSIFAGKNSQGLEAYARMRAESLAGDANVWKNFQKQYAGHWEDLEFSSSDAVTLDNANSFTGIVSQLFASNSDALKVWGDTISQLVGIPDNFSQIISSLTQYQNQLYDNEISNLKSIQENLSKNNSEREKELKLIKAQQALEEAYKDKKKVYRAGIGFTYEANAEAVKSAQEQVDAARKEIDSQNLEYEISLIEQQKNLLGNIGNENSLDYLAEFTDTFNSVFDPESSSSLYYKITESFDPESIRDSLQKIVDNTATNAEAIKEENKNSVLKAGVDAFNELANAQEEYQRYGQENSERGKNARENYRAAINKYNTAVDTMNDFGISGNEFAAATGTNNVSSVEAIRDKVKSGIALSAAEKYVGLNGSDSVMNNILPMEHIGEIASEEAIEDAAAEAAPMYRVNDRKGSTIYFKMLPTDTSVGDFKDQFPGNSTYVYDSETGKFSGEPINLESSEVRDKLPNGTLVLGTDKRNYIAYKSGGLWKLPTTYGWNAMTHNFKMLTEPGIADPNAGLFSSAWNVAPFMGPGYAFKNVLTNSRTQQYSSGSYDTGINSRINELGTEVIVTPQGTLTSLPSHSGIVPADLTRNLFNLGEVAPNLIRRFESNVLYNSNAGHTEDNSTNIDAIYASFETHDGFDANQFLVNLRQVVNNTTNNR